MASVMAPKTEVIFSAERNDHTPVHRLKGICVR